jgi:hypothetical protein
MYTNKNSVGVYLHNNSVRVSDLRLVRGMKCLRSLCLSLLRAVEKLQLRSFS